MRGQLFVCADACCCGRVDMKNAPIDTDLYHGEWMRRRFRNIVHLTVGGCLGPCALANVNLLVFDGRALWLHSLNSNDEVVALFKGYGLDRVYHQRPDIGAAIVDLFEDLDHGATERSSTAA